MSLYNGGWGTMLEFFYTNTIIPNTTNLGRQHSNQNQQSLLPGTKLCLDFGSTRLREENESSNFMDSIQKRFMYGRFKCGVRIFASWLTTYLPLSKLARFSYRPTFWHEHLNRIQNAWHPAFFSDSNIYNLII